MNGIMKTTSNEKNMLVMGEERKIIYFSLIKNKKVAELSLIH